MNKEYVSWNDVEQFITRVETHFQHHHFCGVYGLPRGGLVFAVMLSHRLNIPLLMAPIPGCLIVDDICDSGESLLHYVKNSSGSEQCDYTIATMFYKKNKLGVIPDYFLLSKSDDWIVFPWEEKED